MKRLKSTLVLLVTSLLLCAQALADIIQPSKTLPQNGKPEYLYFIENKSGYYASSTTSPVNEGDPEIGLFAFYAVDNIENAYYIYSYYAKKWLVYDKAESYNNGRGFVKLSDTQVADCYFRLNNYTSEDYDISPYTTEGNVAEFYLNWYESPSANDGISLGLWEDGGSDDFGSAFTFYEHKFTYEGPEWNDYPIFFANAGTKGWSTGHSYIASPNNSSFYLKAIVEVDVHSTLSFYIPGYNDGGRWELYIDGNKVLDTNQNSTGLKAFEELSPGSHVIEWRANRGSVHLYDIAIEKTPYFEVSLQEPGSLGTEILYNVDHLKDVRRIKIKGRMNDDDWAKVKMLENLYTIDFSEAEINEIPNDLFKSPSSSNSKFPFLHKVVLPEGLERIGDGAFQNSHLIHINFPSTLKSIGSYAFAESKLFNAQMNDSITFIGNSAFSRCMYLTDVYYPESMTWVPEDCFWECSYIVNFDMHDNVHDICGWAFYGNVRCNFRMPKNLYHVYSTAFRDTAIDSLIIPEDVYIDEGAFRNCYRLEYAEFPTLYHEFNRRGYPYEDHSPIDNCPNLKTLVLKSPTVLGGNGKSNFLNGCPSDVVIKVPSFLVNSYKLDEYWYNYKIEGFNTGDIKDWVLNGNLVMNARERFDGKPNLTINQSGSIKLNGDVAQVFDSLYTKSYNYYSGTGNDAFARILVNNDVTSIEGEYKHNYYVRGKYWFFVSLPFDFKVSDVTADVEGTKFVFRYYDGALRAANGASGNWKNYADDAVITAGTGFIVQASADCWLTFTALDNESKQYVVSNEEFVKALTANPSENASNSGWNLVGNPWQCWYNIHALNFTAPITTYDVNNKTYNAYSIIDDDYAIEPNEAFFVQCPENINSISFPETGRQLTNEIVNQQSAPARKVSVKDRQLVDILISCGDTNDRTRVVFNDAASFNYESTCDAGKFFATEGECPQLYTIGCDGTEYAINERPYEGGNVQLGVILAKDGKYTFSLPRCNAKEVVLFDNATGVSHNFADGDYTFTAEAGTYTSRFVLGVTKASGTTSLAELESAGITVAAINGGVEVSGTVGAVTILAVDGRVVAEFNGERTVSVAPGTYIVRTVAGTVKVVVK